MSISCAVTSPLLPPLGSFWTPFFLHRANPLYCDFKAPNNSFQIKEFSILQNYIIMQLYTEKLSAHFWFFTGYSEIEYSSNLLWLFAITLLYMRYLTLEEANCFFLIIWFVVHTYIHACHHIVKLFHTKDLMIC